MKHIINIAVVNFKTKWGCKQENYERIIGYIESAYKRGAELIVFPEMCLTGYEEEKQASKMDKMQVKAAESKYGKIANEIAELAKEKGMYIMMGMPERDIKDENQIYNALLVAQPDRSIFTYRKIHLALEEPYWATAGEEALLLSTPWGPIGVTMCYDIYSFPELARYYAAKGARLVINATAYAKSRGYKKAKTTLESTVLMNGIYVATANLCGLDKESDFCGGSSIIGPSHKMQDVYYYAGKAFDAEDADEQEMYIATIDLTEAKREIYEENSLLGRSDFRPNIYKKLYDDLCK